MTARLTDDTYNFTQKANFTINGIYGASLASAKAQSNYGRQAPYYAMIGKMLQTQYPGHAIEIPVVKSEEVTKVDPNSLTELLKNDVFKANWNKAQNLAFNGVLTTLGQIFKNGELSEDNKKVYTMIMFYLCQSNNKGYDMNFKRGFLYAMTGVTKYMDQKITSDEMINDEMSVRVSKVKIDFMTNKDLSKVAMPFYSSLKATKDDL